MALGCSGISWAICKQSAPRCRQITTPTPHHSVFTGRMLFPTPSQQFRALKAQTKHLSPRPKLWFGDSSDLETVTSLNRCSFSGHVSVGVVKSCVVSGVSCVQTVPWRDVTQNERWGRPSSCAIALPAGLRHSPWFVAPSVRLSVCLSLSLSVCLSVCRFICLPVWQCYLCFFFAFFVIINLFQQNLLVLSWECWLTEVDLWTGV